MVVVVVVVVVVLLLLLLLLLLLPPLLPLLLLLTLPMLLSGLEFHRHGAAEHQGTTGSLPMRVLSNLCC